MIGGAARADARAFLERLLRFDPRAVVRLRPARLYGEAPGRLELWAMLPFGVLVARLLEQAVPAETPTDTTVSAAELLVSLGPAGAELPVRRDEAWRWPLPSHRGQAIESIPVAEIVRVAAAASRTLRQVTAEGLAGRAVGERVVRDALLDHVPIVVTSDSAPPVEIPQRLVQAVVRMGFLPQTPPEGAENLTQGDTSVTVRHAGRWIALDCSRGSGWYLPISPLRLS